MEQQSQSIVIAATAAIQNRSFKTIHQTPYKPFWITAVAVMTLRIYFRINDLLALPPCGGDVVGDDRGGAG